MADIIRRRCKKYTPDNMPELTLYYMTMPGEVDVCDAYINGCEISDGLYQIVVESHRAELQAEIEMFEFVEADGIAMDQAGEAWDAERGVA